MEHIKKAFITENEQEAIDFVARFEEGTTTYAPNNADNKYMVIVRMIDGHLLTQIERENLVEIPKDFYTV